METRLASAVRRSSRLTDFGFHVVWQVYAPWLPRARRLRSRPAAVLGPVLEAAVHSAATVPHRWTLNQK